MKKLTIVIFSFFFFIGLINAQTNKAENGQAMAKNQLRGSIFSTIEILKEVEKVKISYGEDSIVYKKALEKLDAKKRRSNFVVWYYNYLTMIENDPYASKDEKKLQEELLFKEANRLYKEKYSKEEWLNQAQRNRVDKEFLEYHLVTDRFINLVLRIYEKYNEDIMASESFFQKILADPDPMSYILRELRESTTIASIKQYRIKSGDTLFALFGKKWRKIAEYNGIIDPAKLKPGQIILIPGQTISIPANVDKVTQFCVMAADQLVADLGEKTILAELTLAILRIETQEGRQIGTGIYHYDMNPSEKIDFLRLCLRLGLDPETTPVSRKPSYGWGGAMGPAQFLPSTWACYEPNVSALINKKFVSPYNLRDAIFAIASKLISGGAISGGDIAEKRAAMIYFAGKNWDESGYQFYWIRVKKELDKIKQNKEIENLILAEEKQAYQKPAENSAGFKF